MSAFSQLNDDSSRLYTFPLSELSNSLKNFPTESNRKDFSSPTTNVYANADDDYRQCRRIRNTNIANQQKSNPNQRVPHQDNSQSASQRYQQDSRPRLSRFWRTVRSLQLGLKTRNQTSQYVEQINHSDLIDRLPLPLTTATQNETTFQRADLPSIESTEENQPTTLMKMFTTDQDDEQEEIPVKGQTLRKTNEFSESKKPFLFLFKFISQRNYPVMKMSFVFSSQKIRL